MDDTQEPETQEAPSWPRWRRRLTGIIIVLAVFAIFGLIAYVLGPVTRTAHTDNARQLVDSLPAERDALLAMQDEIGAPLEQLGDPVRSWTEVICSLSPRYSDGDGDGDLVVFYWQQCSLYATELYAMPDELADGASAAASLGGHTAPGGPICGEFIFDVLTPDVGEVDPDGYTAGLWWSDPGGIPPVDQPDRCSLLAPGGPDTAHTIIDVDEPLTAATYLHYTVASPLMGTDVGCRHALWGWLGLCVGEPEGFPVM